MKKNVVALALAFSSFGSVSLMAADLYAPSINNAILHPNYDRAYLGVDVSEEPVNGGGAKINEILKGGPAEKAGLLKGDVITKIGTESIKNHDALLGAIATFKPKDKVEIVYLRNGKEMKVSVRLAKYVVKKTVL